MIVDHNSSDHDNVKLINVPQQNSFLLVRVGSEVRPATTDDIADVGKAFETALSKQFPNLPIIITHHAVDVKIVEIGG
jgi:hypothetical protein